MTNAEKIKQFQDLWNKNVKNYSTSVFVPTGEMITGTAMALSPAISNDVINALASNEGSIINSLASTIFSENDKATREKIMSDIKNIASMVNSGNSANSSSSAVACQNNQIMGVDEKFVYAGGGVLAGLVLAMLFKK